MVIVLKPDSSESQIQKVAREVESCGYEPHIIRGSVVTVMVCVGANGQRRALETLARLPQIESVTPVQKRYQLLSRELHPADTVVRVGEVRIGSDSFHVIAGPCSVETEQQTLDAAWAVKASGATLLRGGAFKPRTSPYDFAGLGKAGLEILKTARQKTGLPIVTEVMSPQDIELVAEAADMIQIGSRNAQNFALLHAAGRQPKPVLLKRGMASTVEEWLNAA